MKQNVLWWQEAVMYEIYTRSFADSNGDGIGDLNGIIKKLDYLQDLGIGALWLTPVYPSPNVDWGYDISDYKNIHPDFGTLDDFDHLVEETRKRNIRIILDLVLNHTSDQHPWFIESRSSKDSSLRNWYVWHEGKNGNPPNNWTSRFGGSAWEFDEVSGEFYYHHYFKQQPDLNWHNPEVKQAMFDVVRFWLDRGVAGFRLDAISTMYEDKKLQDNPNVLLRTDGSWDQVQMYNMDQPELHGFLKELRSVVNEFGQTVLIGEVKADTIEKIAAYFGKIHDEIHLPMNPFFAYIDLLSAELFFQEVERWDKNSFDGWPYYFFGNHDKPRLLERYSDGKHDDAIAKLLATILLTVRGTPQLYYGEELGMRNFNPQSKEQTIDPVCRIFWPDMVECRDGCRTPMQWNAQEHAGFSSTKPWLPVHPDYAKKNVEQQLSNEHSILNWYKKLIHLRKESEALRFGELISIQDYLEYNIFAYLRRYHDDTMILIHNFSDQRVVLHCDLMHFGINQQVEKIISSIRYGQNDPEDQIILEPYESYVGNGVKK